MTTDKNAIRELTCKPISCAQRSIFNTYFRLLFFSIENILRRDVLKGKQKSSQSKFVFSSLTFPFCAFSLSCAQCHSFSQQMLLKVYDIQGTVLGAEDMKIY